MSEVVAVDIGGTHARFAIAEIAEGRVVSLGEPCTLNTAEHASLQTAWEEFGRQLGRPLPPATGIAIAGPVQGDVLKLTNNPWVIRPALIPEKLGAPRFKLVNDFGAVAHAVAQLDDSHFRHLCGEDRPLPENGVISIVGPGTGLGVAQLLRRDGRYHVIETEGGHIDFAPLDTLEDRILAHLRTRYRRVSVERVASGMGLGNIYEALATIENRPVSLREEKALWMAAMAGEDSLAAAALDRFCLALGAVAGDVEHQPRALTGRGLHCEAGELLQRVEHLAVGAHEAARDATLLGVDDGDRGTVTVHVDVDVAVEVGDVEERLQEVRGHLALTLEVRRLRRAPA